MGSGLELGTIADSDSDGQSASSSTGDDNDELNDDDGVVFNDVIQAGATVSIDVTASASGGRLDAWIDFNADGDWDDSGEQIFTNRSLSRGENTLTFNVPGSAEEATSYARFRLSSAGGLDYDGLASDGEVEDYRIEIVGEIAAIDDAFTVSNSSATLDLLDNDFPRNEVKLLTHGSSPDGTVSRNLDGSVDFDADNDFGGTTSFDYTVAFKQDKVDGSSTDIGDEFGDAVSIDGDFAVVSASSEDNIRGDNAGAVYIYERTGDREWTQIKKLTATDGETGDRFGFSVAIDGDTVVVGARQANVTATSDGAVYVFQRDEGGTDNWGLVKKLIGSRNSSRDHFGHAVAVSGNRIAVGARLDDDLGTNSGSVYIFDRNLGGTDNWGERTRIKASDAQGGDQFGFSVALDGNNLLVGARKDDDAGVDSGSVYFLQRDAGGSNNWGEFNKLTAPDGLRNDWFGFSVALDGNYAVVGKPIRNGRQRPGEVYTYERNGSSWGFTTSFGAESNTDADQFGYSVSLDGNKAAIGARLEDSAVQNAGLIAVHTRGTGGFNNWGLDYELFQDDAAQGDYFGEAVAISGDWIVGGSPFDDDEGSKSGSASFQEIATIDSGSVNITVASSGGGGNGNNGDEGEGSGEGSGSGGNGNLEGEDGDRSRLTLIPSRSEPIGVMTGEGARCCCDQCLAVSEVVTPVEQQQHEVVVDSENDGLAMQGLPRAFESVDALFGSTTRGLFG